METASATAVPDLKLWTRDQIFAAAVASYAEAWKQRAALGNLPLSRMSHYLISNDYPERVRGTLRDTLSYLFVELLADTSMWTPAQHSELYRLDLQGLIAGNPASATSSDSAFADPSVHPIVKIGAVLADLEAWHTAAGAREAALEARLERARRLNEAFSQAEDKARVRADLEKRLPAYRSLQWWSEGMATLGAFVEGDSAPDSQRRARDLFLQGEKAYPETPGAKRCRALRLRIEAPDFSLSGMSSDAPGKRSIEMTRRKHDHLYFRAYPIDRLDRIERQARNELFPQGDEARKVASGQKPVAQWTSDLPATPDYRSHRTFVVPPLDHPGIFLVLASARSDFAVSNNRVLSLGMVVGDLVLTTAVEGGGDSRLRILSGSKGEPVEGAEVRVYRRDWQSGPQRTLKAKSDADGVVVLPPAEERTGWWGGIALVRNGNDWAVQEIGLPQPSKPGEVASSLIFTDRSVYRPQQTVRFKVLAYGGQQNEGRLTQRVNAAVTVTLRDPNNQEVEKLSLTTNRFGTAAGEFNIPSGRPLGQWRLDASPSGSAALRVEEYKRPTFEVTLKAPVDAMRLNRPGKLRGEARYYFGLPVATGTAHWQVTRQAVFPAWWYWWGWSGWWGGGQAPLPQVIASGQSPLAEDGTFDVAFTPAADERASGLDEVSYQYKLSADVTDEGGETRSAERGFRLGNVAVQARVDTDRGFFRAGEDATLTVVRTDLDGEPRAGVGSWQISALTQPPAPVMPADEPMRHPPLASSASASPAFSTPGDDLQPRWKVDSDWQKTLRGWPDGEQIAEGDLTHDIKGEGVVTLPKLAPGAYRLRYSTKDTFGASASVQQEFLVAGPGLSLAVPAALVAELSAVKVGGTARYLVLSGFADQALFLETFRDGTLLTRRRVAPGTGVVELPVTPADRGGFALRLTMLRDHQMLQPAIGFSVPWDDRALEVSFSTFRDRLRPGGHETFRVKVKPVEGAGTAAELPTAEVLAYMYDRSLDLFAPHNPPSPLSLFPARQGMSWVSNSLGQRTAAWVSQDTWAEVPNVDDWTPDRLALLDGYPIGGMGMRMRGGVEGGAVGGIAPSAPPVPQPMMAAKAMAKEARADFDSLDVVAEVPEPKDDAGAAAPPQLRSNFAETAFWQPNLLTGADGTATIEFTVPDSVTSWNVWAHAVTADLRSGSTTKQTQSVKDLMVRPYLPRFLREATPPS